MQLNLAGLGKVAGIGGIAIGAVVLILRPLIEGALPGLEPGARAQAVLAIAVGAFTLGILGIIAWTAASLGGRSGQMARGGHDAAAGGRDAFVNSKVVGAGSSGSAEAGDGGQDRMDRGRQAAKGGRDAAAGGRDAIVNSEVRNTSAADGNRTIRDAKRRDSQRNRP
jgi:hypothetical protein